MDNRPIGFLDSGVGGLTVVKELMRQLPQEEVIYIGDSRRAPYGPRPAEQIISYTWQLVNFLVGKDVKMIVIACNTATALALDQIRQQIDIPIIGVILPGSRAAIKTSKSGQVGIIGTEMTIKSESYKKIIEKKAPKIEVHSLACPKFAPLVESNEINSSITKKVVYESLQPLVGKVDTLVLACTHYPLLRPIIQNVMGPQVKLIDSGAEAVSDISMLLDYFLINGESKRQINHKFYTTAGVESFKEIANAWLDKDIEVEHVDL
ncbi:glutamate racemase [Streptococcaceae bacterium ESL0687]|nr:glutamate racemase [Streptococcaceae bacterium ESL0687]